MLFTLSLRLRKAGPRLGAFHAWNKCLTHVLDLANAYVESVVYKWVACRGVGCGVGWGVGWGGVRVQPHGRRQTQ